MKVISLLQPWAQLMVQGHKLVETRSFDTKHRGPLFIHASGELNKRMKNIGISPLDMASSNEHFRRAIVNPNLMKFGKIIGIVRLVQTYKITEKAPPDELYNKLTAKELAFGNYELGRYMWLCEDAVEFKFPIQLKGQLGIRDSPATGCFHCDHGNIPKGNYHTDSLGQQAPCYNMIRSTIYNK